MEQTIEEYAKGLVERSSCETQAEEIFKGHTMQKEAYLDGYDYAIDKACQWLGQNAWKYDYGNGYRDNVMIDDFRKAMEE